jgi:hypothetical protein
MKVKDYKPNDPVYVKLGSGAKIYGTVKQVNIATETVKVDWLVDSEGRTPKMIGCFGNQFFPLNSLKKMKPEDAVGLESIFNLGSTGETVKQIETKDKQEVPEVEKGQEKQAEDVNPESFIYIGGSLSKIYCDALNKALANESYVETTLKDVEEDLEEEEEPEDSSKSNLYVYACDGSEVEAGKRVKVFNNVAKALNNGKYQTVLLSIECTEAQMKSPEIHRLKTSYESMGVSVSLERNTALDVIKNKQAK